MKVSFAETFPTSTIGRFESFVVLKFMSDK